MLKISSVIKCLKLSMNTLITKFKHKFHNLLKFIYDKMIEFINNFSYEMNNSLPK